MTPSPESEIVLGCVRAVVGGGPPPRALTDGRALNWERLLQCAAANTVAPLLHHCLAANGLDAHVPADCRDRLSRAYYRVAVMNARHLAELVVVLRTFNRIRTPVIVLKGAALAEHVWRNPAVRIMADIDLLVPEAHLDQAARAITALGYRPDTRYRPARWYRREHHHLPPFRKQGDWFVVEVHHGLVRPRAPFSLGVDALWKRARAGAFGGAPARVLCPEDFLVHLCLHLAVDEPFVGRIRDLADVAMLLRQHRGRLNWRRIADEARRGGYAGRLYYALDAAAAILAAPVSAPALRAIQRTAGAGAGRAALTKAFIRRHILADHDTPAVPAWVLQEVCGALLAEEPAGLALVRLLARLHAPADDDPASGAGRWSRAGRMAVKSAARRLALRTRSEVRTP